MKKKLLLIIILLFGVLFVSCSGDESDKPKTPILIDPSPITITAASTEFLFSGEDLELTGSNFVNKDYPTKVFVNEVEVTPKEITDTKILISSPNVKSGINVVRIQIQNINSIPLNFNAIAKGWNKINALGAINIYKSTVLENSKTIFSLLDTEIPKKLEAKSNGYTQTTINVPGFFEDFQMIDDKAGILISTPNASFTDDAFQNINKITTEYKFTSSKLNIGFLESNQCILNTMLGGQLYTNDNGKTFVKNQPPSWAINSNTGKIKLNVKTFGKSTSNGKFYQLGIIQDLNYNIDNNKNAVLESPTGYSDWAIKDTISKTGKNLSYNYKFKNINQILTINQVDNTLVQSTDMMKSWTVLRTNVNSVFLRTEKEWYIQSGDKLLVTKNSGATWELEMDLPVNSFISDISFSKSKIIISGFKGLHYLKLE
ncbi:IPT/TIG domain-containing protein [Flavobacterium sp. FlaQc-47]|uniref:IPT/TIG domain-containing protein n=1 Tax=Flavobacterium sp. FlaQc-47 TaxID=3374180 RepID=UPI0037564FD9